MAADQDPQLEDVLENEVTPPVFNPLSPRLRLREPSYDVAEVRSFLREILGDQAARERGRNLPDEQRANSAPRRETRGCGAPCSKRGRRRRHPFPIPQTFSATSHCMARRGRVREKGNLPGAAM